MKRSIFILVFIFIVSLIFSQTVTVNIKSIPKSVDEFIALRDEIAKTPEGGASMFVIALLIFSQDEALGLQCLVLAADMNRLVTGNTYKGYSLMKQDMDLIYSQLGKQKYIPKTYFKGATPDNNYQIPSENLVLEFSSNQYSGDKSKGTFKVFVFGTGADSPRPITTKMNDKGIWKAAEWSSVIVGVKQQKADKKVDNL